MKRLCTCLIAMAIKLQWLFLDKIRFLGKQKWKYKVNFNFIFIHIKKVFGNILFFGENPGTNQNFIAHVAAKDVNVLIFPGFSFYYDSVH